MPASTLVAIWGAESNFGRFSGVRPTVPALATLAFDPRRATLFRRELFSALEILDRGHIELADMRGSWAGAMGQPQFMPSSYLRYAEDFDGDGRRDIWESSADVFASIANYLKGNGWTAGKRWGREVKVTKEVATRIAADVAPRNGSCQAKRDMTVALPLLEWQRLGVRLPDGGALPVSRPAGVDGLGFVTTLPGLRKLRRAAGLQLRPCLRAQRRAACRIASPRSADLDGSGRPRRPCERVQSQRSTASRLSCGVMAVLFRCVMLIAILAASGCGRNSTGPEPSQETARPTVRFDLEELTIADLQQRMAVGP